MLAAGGGENEPRDIDAQEHSGTPGRAQAQATSRSAHCDAYRLAVDPDRSLYGRGRDRTQLPRAVPPQVDALPHPALHDLGEMLKGHRLAPFEFYEAGRKSLHFVGYEGLSMIAVAGVDMAAWDALARAADVPLCVLLGGSIGAVPAYNSNGLWLRSPVEVAREAVELREEGGFEGLKLRLGRERLADDLATIEAVR